MYGAKSQEPIMPKTALSDTGEASFDYDAFISEWTAFQKRHQRNSHIGAFHDGYAFAGSDSRKAVQSCAPVTPVGLSQIPLPIPTVIAARVIEPDYDVDAAAGYPQSVTYFHRVTEVRAGDDNREHRRMGEIVVDLWRVLIAHISQTSKAIEAQYGINPCKKPFTTTEGNKEMSSNQDKYKAELKSTTTSESMRAFGTSFSPGSLLNSLDETSVESGANAARKCITAAKNSSAETLKSFFPKATRPMYEPLIDRLFCELPGARELVKSAATNTEELQSEVASSQADALSVAIMGEFLQLRAAMRLKACVSMAPEDATELYGVPLKTFDDVFLLWRFVSNDKDDPEKTVVDWDGLRAYAAEQEAANATAAKNANLMTGMDGKSNYGHRFTR